MTEVNQITLTNTDNMYPITYVTVTSGNFSETFCHCGDEMAYFDSGSKETKFMLENLDFHVHNISNGVKWTKSNFTSNLVNPGSNIYEIIATLSISTDGSEWKIFENVSLLVMEENAYKFRNRKFILSQKEVTKLTIK
jgi:hypothetical protein